MSEGNLLVDRVYMYKSIPLKYVVANVVIYIKGKSAMSIARNMIGKKRNFILEKFWARGFFVSIIGIDEEIIR